ncbi:NlpC/P60 family protein [Geoalkalibacter halelectricus]|uniref:NlpC/P60 family protein n=1 Tax=Geoalkalibacter halelectricus TaxID=2847045 RepID=A0ABY5ZR76_9BACT|nr:NlpC/P60 family protein [Geoalkalibacter halelectricus]UWZ80194.1 NlpC/P60 family protein [Geoalkalibacter halelectricus]
MRAGDWGEKFRRYQQALGILAVLLMVVLSGCAAPPAPQPRSDALDALIPARAETTVLGDLGHAIQVGAFASIDNAARLEAALNRQGIDAFFFLENGLYKVRFGNHASYAAAQEQARQMQFAGLIEEFFIVRPSDYARARIRHSGQGDLRVELVRTAHQFLGVPYRWGGTSAQEGFDCSGLTLVCYRLNGLDLPRVSANQFAAGRPIARSQLQKGDLVFFATNRPNQVSHVGIYIGNNHFIHAPRSGQQVRVESLSNSYFQRTFMGARTYL